MAHGKTCLSVVVASLLVVEAVTRATEPMAEVSHDQSPHDTVALTTSQNLLAADPRAFARFLDTARPAPVSADEKARVLSTLPVEGDVTGFIGLGRRKLAALPRSFGPPGVSRSTTSK
jgi:hypothetical protein